MTKMMSNLSRDLAEEVLSRVPVTSLRRVRSTCKKWNTISKNHFFKKKHLGRQAKLATKEREFMVVMIMDLRVYLMSVNLHNDVESCINRQGKLIGLDDSDEVDVAQVIHCDGLLLCITKDYNKLMVWNPYLGQTRWIKYVHTFNGFDLYSYALGYDKSIKSFKILIFIDYYAYPTYTFVEYKIYDFNSDSWRVLDVTPDWTIHYYDHGISLKGNTYWFARQKKLLGDVAFLISFDFTSERFGPRLPVPFEFEWYWEAIVSLCSVREEQLAVLFQRWDTKMLEIWITTKIEPDAVSWNSKVFLAVNMRPLMNFGFQFLLTHVSFFIDEEKRISFSAT
ncbi:PREDICTED: putative F-box protein At3g23420 [Camelina sativa]|uniref:F-box protein At3g23420 n=1 Tax=Camelina sativa TaxID=90675 RepID=A0ABM1QZV5_CAMSA|nr:PREDICTED: putative F-box protein At3g23420 [Camelina sativa]